MQTYGTVRELIALWPTRAALALDLSCVTGRPVKAERVHKWAKYGAIPSGMQAHVVTAARRRGFNVTPADMLDLHAEARGEPAGGDVR